MTTTLLSYTEYMNKYNNGLYAQYCMYIPDTNNQSEQSYNAFCKHQYTNYIQSAISTTEVIQKIRKNLSLKQK